MLKYYTLCNMHTDEGKRKPLNNMFLCLTSCSSRGIRCTSFPICAKAGATFISATRLCVSNNLRNLMGEGRSVLRKMRA